jgi:uncharacterized protein (TIGR00297 family)
VSLPLAVLVSAGVAWIASLAGTLTRSGALAAWTIGALVLYRTGWEGGAVLAAFFVSSNLVSRISPRAPSPRLDIKGDRRDIWQVYANGGPAALAAAVTADPRLALWLVTAGFAAAAADTWATSVGAHSSSAPRLPWSGRRVPPGTSGGVTLAGCGGAIAGALLVAATGALVAGNPFLLPAGTLIGFAGMVADSALGGSVQAHFHCPHCDQSSEWPVHRCGTPTLRTAGLRWLNNDVVNFLATALAVGVGCMVWRWLD